MDIRKIDLFSTFDDASLNFISAIARTKRYEKGVTIFYAGEQPTSLLILLQGDVEVFKHDTEGNELILGTFHPQELIAEMALFESLPYPATARCMSEVVLFEVDFELLKEYLFKHPQLILPMIHSLTKKIKRLESVLRYMLVDDASKRLARFLIDHQHTLSHLTQRNIAQRIKLTPESTSRIIRFFKERKWVEVRQKKLYLLNIEELRAFSE